MCPKWRRRSFGGRRFTWLIDVLYDHRVKLVMSAAVEAYDLYREGHHAEWSSRARSSRLIEINSREYLAEPHRMDWGRDHTAHPARISDADTAAAPICSPWRDTPAPPSLRGCVAVATSCAVATYGVVTPSFAPVENMRASRFNAHPSAIAGRERITVHDIRQAPDDCFRARYLAMKIRAAVASPAALATDADLAAKGAYLESTVVAFGPGEHFVVAKALLGQEIHAGIEPGELRSAVAILVPVAVDTLAGDPQHTSPAGAGDR